MAQPHILAFDGITPVDRGDGIFSRPLVGASLGATVFSNGITTFPPKRGLPLHTHNVDESVTILEGSAMVEVDGTTKRLKAYDTSFVPAGVPHRFVNVGRGKMSILWVYGGVQVTRTFVDTGETVKQLSDEDKRGRRE